MIAQYPRQQRVIFHSDSYWDDRHRSGGTIFSERWGFYNHGFKQRDHVGMIRFCMFLYVFVLIFL